ncbi:dihydroxyacetone kinase subunit DhaL [Tuberibacillus sp. Marseille-P3662]|uniref:dihydroxyacetone kinase subunit DhaL n=1 Tax=Tuberibacillus sp. Marseille-P3662 TaxID=1965358 RepID=UPI000A1CAA6E|nr:dihydroxyacetone kinase subunit DhaL [Tuberibacillus sp. Marseille-P3662]
MQLSVEQTAQWLRQMNQKMQENKDKLSELDQAIGDGDHGHNMARGFQEVQTKIDANTYEFTGDLLKDTAMTLISKVGGASGPLFGTAFLKAASELKNEPEINDTNIVPALEAAVNGIKSRGKANEGDKTMLDVWIPMLTYFKEQDISPAGLAETAETAMEATKDLEAKKGRASYLGERSVGHLDPGSVTSYYLFEALSDVLKEGEA